MEKVPEDPKFRSVFRIFPEQNSGMCSGKFPEQRSGNQKFSGNGKYFENFVMYIVIPTALKRFTLNDLCRSRTHYL